MTEKHVRAFSCSTRRAVHRYFAARPHRQTPSLAREAQVRRAAGARAMVGHGRAGGGGHGLPDAHDPPARVHAAPSRHRPALLHLRSPPDLLPPRACVQSRENMPSCLVRLTLLVLPATLAAGLRANAVKDAVDAFQTGGDRGITRIGDPYCYGTERERSEKGDNKNGDDAADRVQFLDKEDRGNCDADRLCIQNDYEAVGEDNEDSTEDLMTTLYCIGGTNQNACNSMHFACKDPEKCQVVCQKEFAYQEHYVCNSIHVCPGTKVICRDEEGNPDDCDGIANGVDAEAQNCWSKYCDSDEALHFLKT